MYIDAFTSNLTMTVNSKDDAYIKRIETSRTDYDKDVPNICPVLFLLTEYVIHVDAVTNYDPSGRYWPDYSNPTRVVEQVSNLLTTLTLYYKVQVILPVLANDYTQVNDLGYGIVVNNGALTEQVSTFSYYCHAAYMANNGSQIRFKRIQSNGTHGLFTQVPILMK